MRTHFRHIFYLICIILFNEAIGQDPAHYYYDTDAGLPSSEVYDVEIDAKGNLWFATDRGISKYNGFTFQNFDASDGLTGNTVFEIIKSEDNELYFTCYNGSAFKYSNNRFSPLPFNSEFIKLNQSAWIKQINIQEDKFLIQKYNYIPQKFNDAYFEYDRKSNTLVTLKPDSENDYIIYGQGLNKFIYLTEFNIYSNNYIELVKDEYIISVDSKLIDSRLKNEWIKRPKDSKKSLREFLKSYPIDYTVSRDDGEKTGAPTIPSRLYHIKNNKILKTKNVDLFVRKLLKDKKNNIWVCTNKGLLKIDESLEYQESKPLFPHLDISSIIEDKEGSIWLTTINKGVVQIPSLYINQINNEHIANSRVLSLLSYDDKIFLSSHNGSVIFFNDNLEPKEVKSDKRHHNRLQKDSLGLYSHFNSKVIKIDNEYTLKRNSTNTFGVREPFLRFTENELLLGVNTLKLYDPKKGYAQARDLYDFKERLTNLKYGPNKNSLFVGTFNGLYYSDDFLNKPFKALYPKNIDTRVSDISNFNNGFLISTLGKGLYYLDSEFKLNELTSNSEYPLKSINCLYVVNNHVVLLGTNKGLYKIVLNKKNNKLKLEHVYHYTIANGLSSNFIFSIEKLENHIWLSTEKGVNYFQAEEFLQTINPPQVFLDSIISNVAENNYLSHTFSSKTSELNFHITSVSSKKSSAYPFIRYRIENESSDSTWIYTNENIIPIYNLNSGHHKLKVQSRNDLLNWSTNSLEYNFFIKPKFYETLSFKLISIVLIILTILLSYKVYTVRALSKKENELKLKRVELKGKKAELDALRGQMNPHFIYNALNSIQNFIFNGDEEKASSYMSKISRLMRSSLEMSKLEMITIEDEIKFLKNYLDLEKMRFDNKFEYKIIANNISSNQLIPPLLIQPLVENTIKHGFIKMENKKGLLEVNFELLEGKILITVKDNGVGLQKTFLKKGNKEYKSFSTNIIQERLQIINKSNKVDSGKLVINDRIENDKVCGVIAKLFLPLELSYV